MEKPDVDQIDGLSPAISIDQKGASRNPRSTVGTVTEIYDHLRLLFARIGIPHCPNGHAIERQTVQQIVDQVLALPEGTRLLVLGPLIKDRKTEGDRVFDGARRQGFVRVRVDGEMVDIADAPKLDKYKRHSIEVVVDRYIVRHAEAPEGADARADGRPIDPETGAVDPGSRRRPAGRLGRDRAPAGRGRRAHRAGAARRRGARLRGAALQREVQLPVRRLHGRRARAAQLLVQLAARRLPRRAPASGRSSRSTRTSSSRTARRAWRPARSCRGRGCRPTRRGGSRSSRRSALAHGWDFTAPVRDLPPEAVDYLLYAKKDEKVIVRYRHRARREHVQGDLRGRRHEPRAALPRDRLGLHQGRAREVHGHPAVPDLRRQAAPAGDPGGDDRRPQRLGRLDDVDHRRAALGDGARGDRSASASGRSPTSCSRRSSRGSASSSTSGSTT